MSGDKILLEIRNLSYSYGSVRVLEGVNLVIRVGEIVSILGPNGAGKTTLLKCILKILRPRGAIYVNGRSIRDYSERELASIIGYVPQIHDSVFAYRVIDFVVMGRAPYHGFFSTPSREEYNRALRILEDLGIAGLADRSIAEVSGGQLQLILIARALVQDAEILLLDEPTAHLDVSNEFRVLDTIRRLVRRKTVKAVVMTMHNPLTASLFSDKIALIHRGEIIAYGPPDHVVTSGLLEKVYGLEFDVITRDDKVIVLPKTISEY